VAKLRLALTISGAVSLGAYEGGVLAALLSAIRPLCQGDDPAVRLDAIGGASAGSITGLLAARCLTEGLDPVRVMQEAWVRQDSMQHMLHGSQDAPLSPKVLRAMASDLLDASKMPNVDGHQALPVRITMVLACLRGLGYEIRSLTDAGSTVDATTFVDLVNATITHGQSLDAFLDPADASLVDIALASGANALGFPPRVLDRTADEPRYDAAGIDNFPPSKHLWYTDGGTVDNEPLGHTLDLVGKLDADNAPDFRRLLVLIHPHPTGSAQGNAWADPENPPTWLATLMRADHLQRTQSLYDDLRRVEKTNSHIAWLAQVDDKLGSALAALDPAQQAPIVDALHDTISGIEANLGQLPAHAAAAAPAGDIRTLLRSVLAQATGVGEKRAVDLEVISPLILSAPKQIPVEDMLAGEVLFHFGGFFDEHLRISDFDLGYSSTLEWLSASALERHGLDNADSRQAIEAAQAAYTPANTWEQWGKTSVGKVAARHPFALAALMAQIARVAGEDVIRRHPQSH
jgi:predicted acylesterase/phospholipase RssA